MACASLRILLEDSLSTAATIELDMREMEELAFGLNKENEEKIT